MAERADFWKGIVTGMLAGIVIAAYSQWDLFEEKVSTKEHERNVATNSVVSGLQPLFPSAKSLSGPAA